MERHAKRSDIQLLEFALLPADDPMPCMVAWRGTKMSPLGQVQDNLRRKGGGSGAFSQALPRRSDGGMQIRLLRQAAVCRRSRMRRPYW